MSERSVASRIMGRGGPGWCVMALLLSMAVSQGLARGEEKGGVLVIAASARDWIFGAGGTLAGMIDEGRPVYVLQFGNGEKDAAELGPAQTRIANHAEAGEAAKILGVREVLKLGHKSGELAYLSSSEMRNEVMTMVRVYKPEILFFPDWYVHYLDDQDIYRVGRMAEESPYGGGNYFLQEMTYAGLKGYAARFYYFYSPYRPYRAGEGGEGKASFKGVDITPTFERKVKAILKMKTSNHRYAVETKERLELAGRPSRLLDPLNALAVDSLVRAYVEELAETIGKRHGHRYAEEFNHLGQNPGIPEHVLERAKPIQ
jgi:LmbE family N-acetylglucosaminyl deacetylase